MPTFLTPANDVPGGAITSLGGSISSLDFLSAAPEIFLAIAIGLILLAHVFSRDEEHSVTHWLSLVTLGALFFIVLKLWSTGSSAPIYTFSNLFVIDRFSSLLKLFSVVAVSVSLVYGRVYATEREMISTDMYLLALLALLGQMILISAASLVTMFLGLELMSLALYALVAIRRNHTASIEAAMKYFILGALATGFLLYGMSMIYGYAGTLNIPELMAKFRMDDSINLISALGLVFMVCGIAFKLGVVPFHMWVPDVYQGSPTSITLLIGAAPKFAAFAMTYRLLVQVFSGDAISAQWGMMLIVLAVLSLVIGNLAAIMQTNLKRMLAFSTISHMGFVLLGLIPLSVVGVPNPQQFSAASLYYLAIYVLTTLGSFGALTLLSRNNFECDNIHDLKGLSRRKPIWAFIILILMFSMAGIPPTIGFFTKLQIILGLIEVQYLWLAIVAVMASLVGAFYYLRIVKVMYFDAPEESVMAQQWQIIPPFSFRFLLFVNGILLLVLPLFQQTIIEWCESVF